MPQSNSPMQEQTLWQRAVAALERLAPPFAAGDSLNEGDAFVWLAEARVFRRVSPVQAVPFTLLQGMAKQKQALLENTYRFAQGLPANNALLWGARGTGKSSLVKAVHAEINRNMPNALAMIEVAREDIASLPMLLVVLRASSRHFLIFCDDLSFDSEDTSYKSLKSVLEGGIEGRPANVLFYATSNRRHLMPRQIEENEVSPALYPGETAEERISLSDRFGLWLGFYHLDQATYLAIIEAYFEYFEIKAAPSDWQPLALEWATTRGARSGRVAWQFLVDYAGKHGNKLSFTH